MTSLFLIRGIPGSGKSSLAKSLSKSSGIKSVHLEADMYFMKNGVYEWDGMKIGAAHQWCQEETKSYLAHGYSVFVSNTFTTKKELKPYFAMIHEFNQEPIVYVCQNNFGNIHNVPEQVLENMKKRFDYNIEDMFNAT